MKKTPYLLGRQAYFEKISVSDNPFDDEGSPFFIWEQGWREAEQENLDIDDKNRVYDD